MSRSTRIGVTAVTGGWKLPAARFRVRQHLEPLAALGVDVREFCPKGDWELPAADLPLIGAPLAALHKLRRWVSFLPVVLQRGGQVVWLQKGIHFRVATLEWFLKRPIVLDVDDALWQIPPFGIRRVAGLARRAAVVVAGNRFLADWFSAHASDVRIVPTAIDTSRFRPSERFREGRFVVGWTGTARNYPYLAAIERALARFLADAPQAELLVVAETPPRFPGLPMDRVRFHPWSEENEADLVREMDVGLMPLPDTDWCRGKCSFKMIQYMASGIPVVVSPVGLNAEILEMGSVGWAARKESDWVDALRELYRDRSRGREMGRAGRTLAVDRFDRLKVAARLASILREAAEGAGARDGAARSR